MTDSLSTYLDYLPPLFQEDTFLGSFLRAFEDVLTDDLEATIAQTHTYLKPLAGTNSGRAPDEFIPWLANWVSLTLRADWDTEMQRQFIQKIVPLYQLRGTKTGLKQMLEIYLGDSTDVEIYDSADDFGFEPPPYFFQVQFTVHHNDFDQLQLDQHIAQAIIDQEKPAHTFYGLQILMPTMRLLRKETADSLGAEVLILGGETSTGNMYLGTTTFLSDDDSS